MEASDAPPASFWSRTRNVLILYGGATVLVALAPFLVGDGYVPRLAWLGIGGALVACWWGWRHRELFTHDGSLGALRVSWVIGWLLCSGVFLTSGWIARHSLGWVQLLFHLAMAATAWTHVAKAADNG